jgi:hypothetical protein
MGIGRIPTETEWMSSNVPSFMLLDLELAGLQGLISRELRLFACVCTRHSAKWIDSEQSWQAVDVGERYADGLASQDELKAACVNAELVERSIEQRIKEINSETQTSRGREITHDWMWFEIDDWHPEGRRLNAAEAARNCAETVILRKFMRPNLDCCGDFYHTKRASMRAYWAMASREGLEAQEALFLADDDNYLLYEDDRQADLLRCIFRNPFRVDAPDKLEIDPRIRDMAESIYRLHAFEKMPDLGRALEAHGGADSELVAHCIHHPVHARGCWALDAARGFIRQTPYFGHLVRSPWGRGS